MEAHAPASFGCNKVGTFKTNSTIKKFYTQIKKKNEHDMALRGTQHIQNMTRKLFVTSGSQQSIMQSTNVFFYQSAYCILM